jgi:hypothetical protein
MTTPVEPNETSAPEDPLNPDPFATYPSPARRAVPDALPVAPRHKSGATVPIVLGLVAVVVAGAMVFWLARTHYVKLSDGLAANTYVTTTKPTPFAEAGDCALVTGRRESPRYTKVTCAGNRHNYTVSKVSPNTGEKCGEDEDAYVKYTKGDHTMACLIPMFVDGRCYDFTLGRQQTEPPVVECGGPKAGKVRLLANTVDKAACGPDAGLALAYPEIRTTYCFTLRY